MDDAWLSDLIESEDFKNVHDLLAAILIKEISKQVKRSLHRDYVNEQKHLVRRVIDEEEITLSRGAEIFRLDLETMRDFFVGIDK